MAGVGVWKAVAEKDRDGPFDQEKDRWNLEIPWSGVSYILLSHKRTWANPANVGLRMAVELTC